MLRSRALAVLVAAASLLTVLPVDAAPTPKERAEAKTFFAQGKRFVAQEKFDEAVAAFRSANDLDPKAQYQLDLARALSEAGALIEARDMATLVEASNEPNIAKAKQAASSLKKSLAPRIPSLKIEVKGASVANAVVTVNDQKVEPGTDVPFDPGTYAVKGRAGAGPEAKASVELKEGEHKVVPLTLEAAAEAAVAEAPDDGDDGGGGNMVPAAIAYAVGGVGLTIGAIFGVIAFNETENVKEICGGTTCPPEQAEAVEIAQTNGTVSTAMFIVGGVGVAAGVVLTLAVGVDWSDDDAPVTQNEAWIMPYVGAGEVGVIGAF